MKEEIISRKAETIVNELCMYFNTTVENLIPKYAHYAIYKDIGMIVALLIYIILSVIIIYIVVRKENEKSRYEQWENFTPVCIVGVLAATSLIAIVGVITLSCDCFWWHVNPSMRFLNMIVDPIQ